MRDKLYRTFSSIWVYRACRWITQTTYLRSDDEVVVGRWYIGYVGSFKEYKKYPEKERNYRSLSTKRVSQSVVEVE